MAEFNEVANTALEVKLKGKTYKVRRVPMDTIFGKAETAVMACQMQRIHQMAEGLDGDDKSSFLAKAMLEALPTGQRLNQMTTSYLKSVDGVKMLLLDALRKDQPNIEKELDIAEVIVTETDAIQMIIAFSTNRLGKKTADPLASAVEKPLTENQPMQ